MEKRFAISETVVTGPYAPAGEMVIILTDTQTAVQARLQPSTGSDIYFIGNPGGRSFNERCLAGGVIHPGHLAGMSGELQTALMTIGATLTAIPTPGYDHPRHGLHMLLPATPAEPYSQDINAGQANFGISVKHSHEVKIVNTDPRIACDLTVLRKTTMAAAESLGTTIVQTDRITVNATGHVSMLDHPNPRIQADDQIVLPWGLVKILQDRDSHTPKDANPFTRVNGRFLGQPVPERCFFAHIQPNDNGLVPILLAGENCGIGVVYRYLPRHPFAAIWYSPGGCCGLEYGNLPLGSDQLSRLGMHQLYEQGEVIEKEYTIYLLNSADAVVRFALTFGLDLTAPGPNDILACDSGYLGLSQAAAATNSATA